MAPDPAFPRLTPHYHRPTSPPTPDYNCIAWAAVDVARWSQPGVYWPIEATRDEFGLGILEGAFLALGYKPCEDDRPEPGYEKVALYGSSLYYTHAARQLPDRRWTSKLGKAEDIEHDTPDHVAGGIYGEVAGFMKRAATA